MKRIMQIFAGLMVSVLLPLELSAQNVTVSGTVRDTDGNPVIGAAVVVEGKPSEGTVTGLDGKYSLVVSDASSATLTVSCIGYAEIRQALGGASVMDITMEEQTEELEETVVVGYGSMRKSDLTGAVTSVRVDDNEAAHSGSLDQLLQGRAAGVQVVSNSAGPDAGVSIRIRGLSTFNGSTQPLYVVDGIILNTSGSVSLISVGDDSNGGDEETNGLIGINPQDIASIEILKDASATAIYGSQGANGVVLITTKTASSNRPTVTFSAGVYVNTPYKKLDMMGFDEFMSYLDTRRNMGGELGLSASNTLSKLFDDPVGMTGLKVTPADWQDYLMRPSVSQKYYVAISGKSKGTTYRISGGFTSEKGIIRTTGYDNFTLRTNVEQAIGKRFTVGTRSAFSWLGSNLTQGASTKRSGAASSMMRSMLTYLPYSALVEDDGDEELDPDSDEYRSSPAKWITDFKNRKNEIRVTPSLYVQVKLLPWVAFKSTIGGDFRSIEQEKWKSNRINSSTEGTVSAIARVNRLSYNFDNQFQFYKKFTEHKISGTVGMTMSEVMTNTQTVQGWNIPQFRTGADGINTAPNTSYSLSEVKSSLMSFFGRAVYSFRDRYSVTATLRCDGSSKFQGKNKWAVFPSFALAWRISEEPWFNVGCISSLKLRAGWGQVGNQAIASYQTRSNYSSGRYGDHDLGNEAQRIVSVYPANIANPNLKWETSEQFNIGLDYSMWQGALTLSAEFYNKTTKDLLQEKRMATSTGFSSMYMNMGNVLNRGFEITIDAYPVRSYNVEWGIGGNISLNRNKIVSIGSGVESGTLYLSPDEVVNRNYFFGSVLSTSYCPSPLNLFIEGMPMGVFYGMPTDGILKTGETGVTMEGGGAYGPGQIKYVDTNGDGVISELDRVVIGDPNPDFTFGFNTSLRIRQFMLKMTFNGAFGNEIYNVNTLFDTYVNSVNRNLSRTCVREAWTPEHQDTKYTSLDGLTAGDIQWISDRYVENGSFLRLSEVTLSYDLPLKKDKLLKGMTISASGSNLWVFTKYSGWDPDVNSFGTSKLMGADMGSYPGARTFRFDLKLTF